MNLFQNHIQAHPQLPDFEKEYLKIFAAPLWSWYFRAPTDCRLVGIELSEGVELKSCQVDALTVYLTGESRLFLVGEGALAKHRDDRDLVGGRYVLRRGSVGSVVRVGGTVRLELLRHYESDGSDYLGRLILKRP